MPNIDLTGGIKTTTEQERQQTHFRPTALSIAGSDSSGGAGIEADLRSFQRHRVYGTAAITAITAQNATGVQAAHILPTAWVEQQLRSIIDDIPITAAKTGMLANSEIINCVAQLWREINSGQKIPLVIDPVMVATSGANLLDPNAIHALKEQLLPQAYLLTPNLPELAALTEMPVQNIEQRIMAGRQLMDQGCYAVLIKDGHGDGSRVTDILLTPEGQWEFSQSRLSGEFHGTGCYSSAAICAGLARGLRLHVAVDQALATLHSLLKQAQYTKSKTLKYITG